MRDYFIASLIFSFSFIVGGFFLIAQAEKQRRYINANKQTEAKNLTFSDFLDFIKIILWKSSDANKRFPKDLTRDSHA